MSEQCNLFQVEPERVETLVYEGTLPDGFRLIPNFVSRADERDLLERIDHEPWRHELRRRVQHYGYAYNYKARKLTREDQVGELPAWANELGERLVDCEYFSSPPDQVIVNEYESGQGIAPHIDRDACFGPVVASLSLGSDIVMDFVGEDGQRGAALLPACSMVILSGPARYAAKHGIASRKRDSLGTRVIERGRRVSLTYRSVLL